MRSTVHGFKSKILVQSLATLAMLTATLMTNRVGLQKDSPENQYLVQDQFLCNVGLNVWYIEFTGVLFLKLLVTVARFQMYKRNLGQESICAFLTDLILVNLLMTAVFVRGNYIYFLQWNFCDFTQDPLIQMSYKLFCCLLVVGYL